MHAGEDWMLINDLRVPIALAAAMTGLGVFLLSLVGLDLIRAAAHRMWLLASPAAAQQARFRAALAAYQGRAQKEMRRKT